MTIPIMLSHKVKITPQSNSFVELSSPSHRECRLGSVSHLAALISRERGNNVNDGTNQTVLLETNSKTTARYGRP